MPIFAGLVWLWCAGHFGVVGFLACVLPGCLLLASGVSTLLYPGDLRIPQFTALGGLARRDPRHPGALGGGPRHGPLADRSLRGVLRRRGPRRGAPRAAARRRARPRGEPPPRRGGRRRRGAARDDDAHAPAHRPRRPAAPAARGARGARAVPRPRLAREARSATTCSRRRSSGRSSSAGARTASTSSTCASRAATSRGPRSRGASAGWRYASEPHRARLGGAPRGSGAPLAGLHPRLPDGRADDRLRRLRARSACTARFGLNLLLPGAAAPRPAEGRAAERRRLPGRRSARHAARGDERALGPASPALLGARAGRHPDRRARALAGRLPHRAARQPRRRPRLRDPGHPAGRRRAARLAPRAAAPHPPLRAQRRGARGGVARCCESSRRSPSSRSCRTNVGYLFARSPIGSFPPTRCAISGAHWGRPRIVWYQGGHVTFRLHREVRELVDGALAEAGLRV